MACFWEELETSLWFSKENENGAPRPSLHLVFGYESQIRHKEECLFRRATFTHQILGWGELYSFL